MKKIYYLVSLLFAAAFFFSCQEKLDNWYSETFAYDGRYVFKLMSEDMQDTYIGYEDGAEIYIYNTADNVAGAFWLEDQKSVFPIKSKFSVSGDASSFKSTSADFEQLSNNIFSIEELPRSSPTALNQTVTEGRDYTRASILEGKILPGAATSIGGNKSDSLYIKLKLLSGTATYESYELPASSWEDPEIPEYGWKFKSAAYDSSLDETYVIAGYRYTGMPEDH
jgi:hypothetical protein